ncbi:MAG: MFS transporter, partial [Deltaproteobacteria bacterium]|nr:MFS transporter [Deltaproteobacteria bacterium]
MCSDRTFDREKRVLFGVCATLFVMSMFYRMSAAVIAEDLGRDLHLDPGGLGLVGGAFFYAFALVQLPLGLLLDRAGAKRTMIILNLTGMLGAFLFSIADGLATAVLGRILIGVGMASNLMGSLKLFTHWFDLRRFATLSGLLVSLGTLGTLAATSPLVFLSQALGWRSAFQCLAAFHGLLVLALALLVHESPSGRPAGALDAADIATSRKTPSPHPLGTLFRSGSYWAISWSIFLRYGALASIQALWAGPFLMVCLGFSQVRAGNILLMLSVGFILGAPAGGFVSDRILRSRRKAVSLAMACSAAAILALSRWPVHAAPLLLGTLLFINGFFNSFNQISYAHIRELMPPDMSGTAMTGINVFTMAGAGVFVHGLG